MTVAGLRSATFRRALVGAERGAKSETTAQVSERAPVGTRARGTHRSVIQPVAHAVQGAKQEGSDEGRKARATRSTYDIDVIFVRRSIRCLHRDDLRRRTNACVIVQSVPGNSNDEKGNKEWYDMRDYRQSRRGGGFDPRDQLSHAQEVLFTEAREIKRVLSIVRLDEVCARAVSDECQTQSGVQI